MAKVTTKGGKVRIVRRSSTWYDVQSVETRATVAVIRQKMDGRWTVRVGSLIGITHVLGPYDDPKDAKTTARGLFEKGRATR